MRKALRREEKNKGTLIVARHTYIHAYIHVYNHANNFELGGKHKVSSWLVFIHTYVHRYTHTRTYIQP